jgi:HSP20 family protein
MATMKWNPHHEIDAFQREMNRLFTARRGENDSDALCGNWTPAVNILEEDESYAVQVALPGLDEKDINVNIENNTLTVSGERKLENEEKRESYTRIEQLYGTFVRSFSLPNTIDTNGVDATMSKGVLTVTLPKREETKPKSIQVKVN